MQTTDRHKRFYSTLICPVCGLRMTIPREARRKRKEGHIKTMFCGICRTDRNFVENNYVPMSCSENKDRKG